MRFLLGAYVLKALTLEEDRTTADHLRECDECSAEYLEMTEAQCLLSLISEADLRDGLEDLPDPDEEADADERT